MMLNRDTVHTIGSVIAFPPVSVQYRGIQTSWIKNGCFVFHQPSKRQRQGTKLWVNFEQLIRQCVLMHSLSDTDFFWMALRVSVRSTRYTFAYTYLIEYLNVVHLFERYTNFDVDSVSQMSYCSRKLCQFFVPHHFFVFHYFFWC